MPLPNALKQALRQVHRGTGPAVLLTLALAIGVNAAVFSVLDGLVLRSLPYPHPEGLAALVAHAGTSERADQDGATWEALQARLKGAIAAAWGATDGVNLGGGGSAVRYVQETRVSAGYFRALGIPLFRGRGFSQQEDQPHGPDAVILSHRLWHSAFHAAPDLLGRAITLQGAPYTVVGILPAGAATPSGADLFTPLRPAKTGECGGTNCDILLRLEPGANWSRIAAELATMPHPDYVRAGTPAWYYTVPLQRYLSGDLAGRAEVLMLVVALILLIACANLAGLTLVRTARRAPEIATRLALGASRARILGQLWLESLVLATLGGVLGLALSALLLRGIAGLVDPAMIPVGGFRLDGRVLGFGLGAAALTSVLFGALPALTALRVDLRSAMGGDTRTAAAGGARLRQALIAGEVALTLLLLAGAGLLVRTLTHLESLPPGFDPQGVITAKASLDEAQYQAPADFQALLRRSLGSMRRIPGVEAAGVGLSVPYESPLNDGITVMDGPRAGVVDGCSLSYVTEGYFSALRIPLVAGRRFNEGDTSSSPPVAIVNAAFGPHFYGEPLPLGRHFKEGDTVLTIVGVVATVLDQSNVRRVAPLGGEPMFYIPATQVSAPFLKMAHLWMQPSWVVRAGGPIAGVRAAMQGAMSAADPNLPLSGVYSMQDLMNQQLRVQRVEVSLLGVLAGLALLLSAIGIYALVANTVAQRTRELGVRLALGSTVARAMMEISRGGLAAAGVGAACGLGLCVLGLPVLSSELYGVGTFDPVTLAAVPLLLLAVAAGASWLPACRVATIDPAATLRAG